MVDDVFERPVNRGDDPEFNSVTTDETSTKSVPLRDVTHPDYGAVGDGSTDDFAAIDAAISDATGADGAQTVYFPDVDNGTTYLMGSARLITGSNLRLKGPGKDHVTIKAEGGSGISQLFQLAGATNIKFEGLTLDLNGISNRCLNVFDAMTNLVLDDVRLTNAQRGIDHNASGEDFVGLTARNVEVSNMTSDGIRIDGRLKNAEIEVEAESIDVRPIDILGNQLGEGRNENVDVDLTARGYDGGENAARIEGVDGGSVLIHGTSPEADDLNGGSGDMVAIRDCRQFSVRPGSRVLASGDQGIVINGGKAIEVFGHVQKCNNNGVRVTTSGSTGSYLNATPTDVTIQTTSKNNGQDYNSAGDVGNGIYISHGENIVVVGSHVFDDQGSPTQQYGVEVDPSVTSSEVEIVATRSHGNATANYSVPEGTPVNGQANTSGTANSPSGSAVPNRTRFRYDDTDDSTGDGVYYKDDSGTIHGPI